MSSQLCFFHPIRHVGAVVLAAVLMTSGCKQLTPLDTTPLDHIGMSFDTIQKLKGLKIAQAEVPEISTVRQAGLPEPSCVEIVRIYHNRNMPFDAGDAVAGLVRAGLGENTILDLANMNQLGLEAGEMQAMRLAGLSDAIVLEFARRKSANMPVLSGASLAALKNTGLSGSALLELVRRGVPDSQKDEIVSYRRHGASEAEVLRRFSGS